MKRIIQLEDAKTGIKYRAVVREMVKQRDIGFNGRIYYNAFDITFQEAVRTLFGITFYENVNHCSRDVEQVTSVTDYVVEEFKVHLKDVERGMRERQYALEKQEKRKREMKEKYDSIPDKIIIK